MQLPLEFSNNNYRNYHLDGAPLDIVMEETLAEGSSPPVTEPPKSIPVQTVTALFHQTQQANFIPAAAERRPKKRLELEEQLEKVSESSEFKKPTLEKERVVIHLKKRTEPTVTAAPATGKRTSKKARLTKLGTFDENDFISRNNGKVEICISERKYAEWKKLLIVPEEVWKTKREELLEIFRLDVARLSSLIDKYEIPYPLKEITQVEALKDFKDLKEENEETYTLSDKKPKFKHSEKYREDDLASPRNQFQDLRIGTKKQGIAAADYFQRHYRLSCNSNGIAGGASDAPLISWKNDVKRERMLMAMANYVREKGNEGKDTIPVSRIRANMERCSKVCWDFRPMIVKGLINILKDKMVLNFSPMNPIDVLDPCGGFGGRPTGLIGTPGIRHIEIFDPNVDLKPGYQQMLDLYGKHTSASVKINMVPAEEMTAKHVGGKTFKLLVTSPPYFNQEQYCHDETQSWKRYPALKDWQKGFLNRMLYKAYKRLDHEGVMAINIADVNSKRGSHGIKEICVPMLNFLEKMGMDYQGCIPLTMGQGHEPFWIVKKNGRTSLAFHYMFKSSEMKSVEDCAALWNRFQALSEIDKDWIGSFLIPKFWNTVRKRMNAEPNREAAISNLCAELKITRDRFNDEMKRPEPIRNYTVLKT